MELIEIVGKESKKGKPQHLKIGRVYKVPKERAEQLIRTGQAYEKGKKPKPNAPVKKTTQKRTTKKI